MITLDFTSPWRPELVTAFGLRVRLVEGLTGRLQVRFSDEACNHALSSNSVFIEACGRYLSPEEAQVAGRDLGALTREVARVARGLRGANLRLVQAQWAEWAEDHGLVAA